MKFILQSSDAPENCGFTRWVYPAPIDSVQEFIEYLQIKIFDLECQVNHYEEVSEANKDNAAASQDDPCTIPYCNCPFHKKKGPAAPAPPPAPPAMGGYCGEGSTQFATWGYDY